MDAGEIQRMRDDAEAVHRTGGTNRHGSTSAAESCAGHVLTLLAEVASATALRDEYVRQCKAALADTAQAKRERDEWFAAKVNAEAERDKLAAFKAYVHSRLDAAGVTVDPESAHKAEGCRIGGRLDEVFAERDRLRVGVVTHQREVLNECIKISAELAAAVAQKEVANLRAAITAAGFAVMQTSGAWSIHDVSEHGKTEEAKSLEVASQNVWLEVENERLRAALKPLARAAEWLPDGTEDDVYLGTQLRGLDNDTTPTVGEIRHAANLLAAAKTSAPADLGGEG